MQCLRQLFHSGGPITSFENVILVDNFNLKYFLKGTHFVEQPSSQWAHLSEIVCGPVQLSWFFFGFRRSCLVVLHDHGLLRVPQALLLHQQHIWTLLLEERRYRLHSFRYIHTQIIKHTSSMELSIPTIFESYTVVAE
jgi:hypothetical protein